MSRKTLLPLALLTAAVPAHATLTVLVGEPFGSFGTMFPVGHTTVYLDRVCADTPTHLHMCLPGEAPGVALARYDHLGTLDWIATPILPFLYGTSDPGDVLPYATPKGLDTLRRNYRKAYLEQVFPEGQKRNDEWVETVGVAYIRRTYGYSVDTTVAQDEALVEQLNTTPNIHRYHVRNVNCADFVADIVNAYYPGTIRSAGLPDLDVLSPKQVARCMDRFGHAHPELHPAWTVVEQTPGSLRRSRPIRFFSEMLLFQKRYVFTLAVIQPEAVLVAYGMYRANGPWKPGTETHIEPPSVFFDEAHQATPPASTASAQSSTN